MLEKRTESEKEAYMQGYDAGYKKGIEKAGAARQFNADNAEKTAEWIKQDYGIGYRCTNCGKIVMADDSNELNFCCNCGARMKGV